MTRLTGDEFNALDRNQDADRMEDFSKEPQMDISRVREAITICAVRAALTAVAPADV